MGKELGFLISEMWILLAAAGFIGLFAGWIIWGGRQKAVASAALEASRNEVERLSMQVATKQLEIKELKDAAEAEKAKPAPRKRAAPKAKPAAKAKAEPKAKAAPKRAAKKPSGPAKPIVLKKARRGKADDLTKIKGVGPKLEAAINDLGIYHYDQVAKWSAKEAAWVDENLGGIKGRIQRDKWVSQAKGLMNGA